MASRLLNMKKRIAIVVGTWDTVWKVVALVTAVRNRQWRWVVPLATVSSAGILPMVYLWRFAQPAEVEEPKVVG
jgi:hypothetical protein